MKKKKKLFSFFLSIFFLNLQFDDQAQAIHFAASYTLSLFMISPATDGAMIPRIGDPGGGGGSGVAEANLRGWGGKT